MSSTNTPGAKLAEHQPNVRAAERFDLEVTVDLESDHNFYTGLTQNISSGGVFIATQAALKHMKSGGRIISIGSAVGERVAAPGLVPYAGTKGAVKMFTQALSREVGSRGITVNNVQPGPIDTDLNPAAGDWAVPQKAATSLDRYGR